MNKFCIFNNGERAVLVERGKCSLSTRVERILESREQFLAKYPVQAPPINATEEELEFWGTLAYDAITGWVYQN
jgi:hypothetical protein